MKSIKIILIVICLCMIPQQMIAQDILQKIYARIDSTAIYRLGSTWEYGGATGTIAATTWKIYYNDSTLANEYLVIHQFRMGMGIVGLDYNFTGHATIINEARDDSTSVYGQLMATASETVNRVCDIVAGGQRIIVRPGEKLHLKGYNNDNETDAIWHSYIIERVKF